MTTKKIGNARLLKVAALLRSLPRKRFDYGVWVGDDWKGAPDLSCGTKACALGWATTIPSIRKAGLSLVQDSSVIYVSFKGEPGPITGAAQVFGMAWEDAQRLFVPRPREFSATPKQVAKKIEKFVAGRA